MTRASKPRELLTPAALHVLLSLVDGPRHGYGIQQDVGDRTGGELRLGPGTLYEAIHRLLGNGLIEEAGQVGRRKNYRLTRQGRRELKEELSRLDGVVRFARAKDLLGDSR